MKVAIWAISPSLHQRDFYAALRKSGIDLRICYFGHLCQERRDLGWTQPAALPAGEQVLPDRVAPLRHLADWQERIHVIPGYSRWTSISIAMALSKAGVPWVHWSENSRPSWRSALFWPVKQAYARLVNRYALGAFAIGDSAARDFIRWGARPEMIAHLYYAVRGITPGIRPDPATARFTAGKTAFVFVGAICRNKGSKELVRAFAQAAENRDDACLVMVGDGPHRAACERLASRLRIADRVLFRGVVAHADVGSVLTCCHVAVLPSRYDGWGVVLNEAASAKLALVASAGVGAAYHLIEPGWNGFRSATANASSLAVAMRAYVNDRRLAREHGERSWRRFQEFLPDRNAERFISAIRGWLAARDGWDDWRRGTEFDAANRAGDQAA